MNSQRARVPRSVADLRFLLTVRSDSKWYRRLADAKFIADVATARNGIDRQRVTTPPGGVDAEHLASALEVELHSQRADEFFGAETTGDERAQTEDAHLRKPFTDAVDASNHLAAVANLLSGLDVARGMRVLDFGCGNGWVSRILIQLGCEVVLCDVSQTALDIAAEAFRRSPPLAPQEGPAPRFLLFDGHRLDLADGEIDRITCFDAFHHVPNRSDVLAEMHRVLAPDGLAGFHEPGPDHSRKASSQFEMINFGFLERDILIGEIRTAAQQVGFTGITLNLAAPILKRISVKEYDRFLRWARIPLTFKRLMWHQASGTRVFYLAKESAGYADSRQAAGLAASIDVANLTTSPADSIAAPSYHVVIKNTGRLRWLPSEEAMGGVRLGALLYRADGTLADLNFARWDLSTTALDPGQTVEIDITLPSTEPGARVVLDLVAENVSWFAKQGSPGADLPVA